MNDDTKPVRWYEDAVVIHTDDAKDMTMLRRVLGYTRDGLCRTRYLHPQHAPTEYRDETAALLAPEAFGLTHFALPTGTRVKLIEASDYGEAEPGTFESLHVPAGSYGTIEEGERDWDDDDGWYSSGDLSRAMQHVRLDFIDKAIYVEPEELALVDPQEDVAQELERAVKHITSAMTKLSEITPTPQYFVKHYNTYHVVATTLQRLADQLKGKAE